jgi:hypothetical protein
MTTFDKREEGFEKKFAHDEELKFKAAARRNKLLGLWAAEKLGLTGAAADAYAKEVVSLIIRSAALCRSCLKRQLPKSRPALDGTGAL